jgi:hypothetical protein
MDRRGFLLTSLTGALVGPLVAWAQQAGKPPRIGLIGEASASSTGFGKGLRELGYREGENILVEYRYAHGLMPICRSSSRPRSSWSSTSRRPRASAWRSRPRCWRGRIR